MFEFQVGDKVIWKGSRNNKIPPNIYTVVKTYVSLAGVNCMSVSFEGAIYNNEGCRNFELWDTYKIKSHYKTNIFKNV